MPSPQPNGALEYGLFALRVLLAVALYAFLAALLRALLRERPAEIPSHAPTAWLMPTGDSMPVNGHCYAIRSGAWIGRDPQCAICFNDESVGECHACITWDEEAQVWYIEDDLSESGTFVNGQRISRAPLADGDVIQIGQYKLTFLLHPIQSPSISPPVLSAVRRP
jgi:hypothetical protein